MRSSSAVTPYVDHPSFGTAVISRVLEAEGLRVAVLAQPDWHDAEAFRAMGRPRLGVFIGAGNLDSMVAHYTAAKRRRSEDFYSPGKRTGCRPDRAAIVYCNRAREAFGPDVPIILGSLEASLRRFAHYDYWDDSVRRAILFDAPADLLVYGMGEAATIEIAHRLKKKQSVHTMTDIPGTGYITRDPSVCTFDHITLPSFEDVRDDKRLYAEATRTEYAEHDPVRGRAMIQPCEGRYLVITRPPCRSTPKSSTAWPTCPTPASGTRCMSRSAACPRSRRCASASSTTAAASAGAISARWRSIRGV